MRYLLDSNAVDVLIDTPGALEHLRAAIRDRQVELLFTPLAAGQLNRTPDLDRRRRLLAAVNDATDVPDTWAIGLTSIEMSRIVDEEMFAAVKPRNGLVDASVAQAAKAEGAVLVTADENLRKDAGGQGVTLMLPVEFVALLASLAVA